MASGAKFNINKTVVIPLGDEDYRDRLRERRRLRRDSAPIPDDIKIAQEGEPVRILGAYFGHGISEKDVWEPTIKKIESTLARWERNYPTIKGLALGNNTMVGGLTQYLTRVQGMPPDTVKRIRKMTDNFVYAKHGETKSNTISLDTLFNHWSEGGLSLLDLEARNEAIDLMRLRTYLLPPELRPVWCDLADRLLARAAVKKFHNVGIGALINPFLQTWKVNLSATGLPMSLKRMMRTAYKYDTALTAVEVPDDIKTQMPIWYHAGAKTKLKSIYGDKWGVCQRETHHILTVDDMLHHTARLRATGCSLRKNCKMQQLQAR
ncbi:hypothetical protein DFP72DRAFT_812388 [Ephemerocybe angulata]|uniref:Uncharacterized protein n=1 Tax=Ephemerocybe angulata TaxID=980116 RepID=A0A8H6HYH3_9AGAR|nr:hypothetical protein DFP72DRAFT_812388 [Tulosesus angulatus]